MRRLFALVVVSCLVVLPLSLPASAAAGGLPVNINANNVWVDNYEGWGTTLCYPTILGSYLPVLKRQEIADYLYDPDTGLGLNIVRYNIYGGENPNCPWGDHFWTPDVGQGFKDTENGPYKFNENTNEFQRWWLDEAAQRIAEDEAIYEAFAVSPPWWMTNSGCAAGGINAANNLNPAYEDAFVDYLLDTTAYLQTAHDITFRSISPINEPDGWTWYAGYGQEGCTYGDAQMIRLINKIADARAAKGLGDIIISAPEGETYASTANHVAQIQEMDITAYNNIGQVNTHAYGYGPSPAQPGKPLWMSEVGFGSIKGPNNTDMTSALMYASKVTEQIRDLGCNAWVAWRVFGDEGFFTPIGDNSEYEIYDKPFYSFSMYTRFIRPGYQIIGSDEGRTLVAYSPEDERLVIVIYNNVGDTNYTYNLAGFSGLGSSAEVFRTSATENCAAVGTVGLQGHSFTAQAAANSVTTYVIDNAVRGGDEPGDNLVTNPDFGADNTSVTTQEPSGWYTWFPGPEDYSDANYVENGSYGNSPPHYLVHWLAADYDVTTYQTITGLENGTYEFSAWVQSSGGQQSALMMAQYFGSSDIYIEIPPGSSYRRISTPVYVSNASDGANGSCQIGFRTVADANQWIRVDDVSFIRTGE